MPRCKNCNNKFQPKYFLAKFCGESTCLKAEKEWQEEKLSGKKPKPATKIKQVSDKRKIENLKYSAQRIVFLGKPENQKCPITGKPTTDVHHMRGRVGNLFLDERYWIALSREGHRYVEENPEWAKEQGYSLNRLTENE